MVTGLKNITAFKQHAEEMEFFRRAHEKLLRNKIIKPVLQVPEQPDNTPGPDEFKPGINSKNPVVSIWDITMPKVLKIKLSLVQQIFFSDNINTSLIFPSP